MRIPTPTASLPGRPAPRSSWSPSIPTSVPETTRAWIRNGTSGGSARIGRATDAVRNRSPDSNPDTPMLRGASRRRTRCCSSRQRPRWANRRGIVAVGRVGEVPDAVLAHAPGVPKFGLALFGWLLGVHLAGIQRLARLFSGDDRRAVLVDAVARAGVDGDPAVAVRVREFGTPFPECSASWRPRRPRRHCRWTTRPTRTCTSREGPRPRARSPRLTASGLAGGAGCVLGIRWHGVPLVGSGSGQGGCTPALVSSRYRRRWATPVSTGRYAGETSVAASWKDRAARGCDDGASW